MGLTFPAVIYHTSSKQGAIIGGLSGLVLGLTFCMLDCGKVFQLPGAEGANKFSLYIFVLVLSTLLMAFAGALIGIGLLSRKTRERPW